jgi:hypothetical protein
MSSSLSYEFLFEDSSSSDDSNLEEPLNDEDTEHMILILAAKELQDRAKINWRRDLWLAAFAPVEPSIRARRIDTRLLRRRTNIPASSFS